MASDQINLTLEPREVTGKAVKHLRKEGTVPAVIHDRGKDSVNVQADYTTLFKIWQQAGKHHPVKLSAAGKKYTALIKDISLDPKKNTLTHMVFHAVDVNEKVDAEIPIHAKYAEGNESSPAERNSLIVLSQLDVVMVAALPDQLPDALYYDAEKLVEVGDSLTVADLDVPEGVEIKADENHSVATVYEPSALAAANDAAGGDAEPGDEQAVEVTEQDPENVEVSDTGDEIRPGGKKEFEDKEQGRNPTKE